MTFRTGVASALLATVAILVPAAPVAAQENAVYSYDLPAQDLETSLRAVGRTTGHQIIIATASVEGRTAPALKGQYSAEQAVRALLADTGIKVRVTSEAILVGESDRAAATDRAAGDEEAITVTGSRIKNARLASSEITIDRQDIQRAGFGDLGEALQVLPQNFGGGQNPGVGLGAQGGGSGNQNVTGGSSVNLRGLGADATLTLLNGHRLSFGGLVQGVDISAIPIDAIDRVDIVPDGASALYGSDAVAGVVNVVLRRSFDGLSLRTRLGAATDGGAFSQQYQAVLGQQWTGGGVVAAYGFRRDARIEAEDRSYTSSLGRPYPLVPGQYNHSVILTANQSISGGAEVGFDATYNKRKSPFERATFGILQFTEIDDETFALAPNLTVPLGPSWKLTASSVYSQTKTNYSADVYLGDALVFSDGACYCHKLFGFEAFVEGPIMAFPGGTARTVLGGGFRRNKLELIGRTSRGGGSESAHYLFAEVSIPVLSADNDVPWARAISITAAGRYDSYERAGEVFTPRFGLVYSPSADLDLKFSWGRSFKAPSLFQQNDRRTASVSRASSYGDPNVPATATGIAFSGGSPDLRPERATTQSWTAAFHPDAIAGLSVELSLFRIRYTDRVLSPIPSFRNAVNPAYAEYVIVNPTLDQVQEALSETSVFVNNTGREFDPATVMYLIRNYNLNIAVQKIKGLDFQISYNAPLAGGTMKASAGGSYLESKQKNGPTSEYFKLAGTAWQPPHWRARGSIGWAGSRSEIVAYVNYTDGVRDQRTLPYISGSPMFTTDLSASYTVSSSERWFDGLKAQIVVSNLFDRRPPYLRPAAFAEPYDSTNYSPVGRFISFSLSKQF